MTRHDGGYHALFSHPELVADLILNFVPDDWVKQLDFSAMTRVNAKFHAEGLEKREGDLIYRIPYKERQGEIYLYLLLEFQSTPDKWMPLRALVYVGLLYQQLIRERLLIDDRLLPPVFPLVLYNGDKPWLGALDLQSLIALPPNSPLHQWQPQMSYYLLDESRYPVGVQGSISGALFRIENTRDIKALRDNVQLLVDLVPQTNATLKRALVTWLRYVIAPHKKLNLRSEDVQELTEVKVMLSTRLKQWEQEFLEKGRLEGREQGRQEGQRITLRKMLVRKFGPLPDWAEQQIEQGDTNSLEKWIENLFDANQIEDIFK